MPGGIVLLKPKGEKNQNIQNVLFVAMGGKNSHICRNLKPGIYLDINIWQTVT